MGTATKLSTRGRRSASKLSKVRKGLQQ